MRSLLFASAAAMALMVAHPGMAQTTQSDIQQRAVGQDNPAPADMKAPTDPTVPAEIQVPPMVPSSSPTLNQPQRQLRGDLQQNDPTLVSFQVAQNDTQSPAAPMAPHGPAMNQQQDQAQPAPMPANQAALSTEGYNAAGHEPMSRQAANIDTGNMSSTIAPRLPSPGVGPDATPAQLLHAARDALGRNATGQAQEALERAETRLLDRSTAPSNAGAPDAGDAVALINQARMALGHRDMAGAGQAIDQALQRPAVQNFAAM